jgi:hypothetical protein
MGISPTNPCDTGRRNYFAERFPKNGFISPTESALPAQPQPELPQPQPEPCQTHPKISLE